MEGVVRREDGWKRKSNLSPEGIPGVSDAPVLGAALLAPPHDLDCMAAQLLGGSGMIDAAPVGTTNQQRNKQNKKSETKKKEERATKHKLAELRIVLEVTHHVERGLDRSALHDGLHDGSQRVGRRVGYGMHGFAPCTVRGRRVA